jgi:hypothetical protein
MTEFPAGLILANCIFKGFFRQPASVALPLPSGELFATHISYATHVSDPINSVPRQIRMALPGLIWNSRNNSSMPQNGRYKNAIFWTGPKSSRGCPCVPSQNTESMLTNAAS